MRCQVNTPGAVAIVITDFFVAQDWIGTETMGFAQVTDADGRLALTALWTAA